MYSWWWVRLSPETCRVKPLRRIKTQLLHLVGLISLHSEKSCPSSTFSNTNLTWIDLGSNPGLRNDRSVTDPLKHLYEWGKQYTYSVSTSQRTYPVSVTKTNRLTLYRYSTMRDVRLSQRYSWGLRCSCVWQYRWVNGFRRFEGTCSYRPCRKFLTACTLQTKARIIRNVGNHLPNDAASHHVLRAS